MYTTALPQRPRPPGARRTSLRSSAGEAPPLPSKHSLKMQDSPVATKGSSTKSGDSFDMYTSPIQRPGFRRRPLSLLSETSVLSPPPPYGGGRDVAPSPDKASPIAIPPPPPESIESGPASVRNSLFDNEGPSLEEEDETEDECLGPGNTLTLRGVQKLIRQHEFAMSDQLQGRLLELTSSPNATLPSQFDLDSNTSPRRSSPARRLRTVPSDPGLAFSRPRSRIASHDVRDLRLAAVRAEEDAATILQLENALAEARDGEEAQRKAAARLRRDLSRMKRELEHAEHTIVDSERNTPISDAGRDRLRSLERVTQWAAVARPRARGSYGPPPDDEPVGWGATAFPEFPRYPDVSSEAEAMAASVTAQSTQSTITQHLAPPTVPSSRTPSQNGSATVQGNSSAASASSDDPSETPMSTVVVFERVVKPRPPITASTFASPANSGPAPQVAPTSTLSVPSSSYGTLVGTGSRRARSIRAGTVGMTGTSSSLLKESMRLRTRSFNSRHLSPPSHARKISDVDAVPPSPSTLSGASELSSVLDSVRSIYSAVVGAHRSLGSELGSGFQTTPIKSGDESSVAPSSVAPASVAPAVPYTPVHMDQQSSHVRHPSHPTTMFHFRGTLESPSRLNAYDHEHPEAPLRMGPVEANWTPQSWPTPCPPPREPSSDALDFSEELQVPQVVTPQATLHRGWPSLPGTGPGLTPSPHYTTGLAPCADPWDEYSDRLTPSPRMRNLRPLLLCARPGMHTRTSSLALAKDRSASRAGFKFPRIPPQPVPQPTPSNVVVSYTLGARQVAPVPQAPIVRLPVTIPGRITHDVFCLVLVFLDYLEWFIILLYRFTVDLRAGPSAAEAALGFKRREHPKRFYL